MPKKAEMMKASRKYSIFLLYGVVLFLPLNLQLNNVLLFLFTLCFIFEGEWKSKWNNIKQHAKYLIPFLLIFLSVTFGYFNSTYAANAIGLIERSIPIILLPLLLLSQPELFQFHKKTIFNALAAGCVIAALICWGSLLIQAISEQSFSNIFSWRSTRQKATSILDIHPSYISIFLFTAIGFIAKTHINRANNKNRKTGPYVVLVILITFLFQLLSRTALIYFMFASILFLVLQRKFKLLLGYVLLIATLALTIFYGLEDKSQYFERVLLKETGIAGEENLDKRFVRWKVLLDLFAERPLLGHGTGDVEIMRAIKFKEMDDLTAYKHKYNAHNQYLETLVSQGAVGLFFLLFALGYLIYICLRTKSYFFLFALLGFMFCAMTESLLQRSWGIVYFSLISGMLLVANVSNQNQSSTNHNLRS